MSKLLDAVREAVRTRHYSIRTEEAYLRRVREYIFFFDKRHPKSWERRMSALSSPT